jgi:hypothetical protein
MHMEIYYLFLTWLPGLHGTVVLMRGWVVLLCLSMLAGRHLNWPEDGRTR